LKKLEDFKKDVSIDLMVICQKVDAVKDKFKAFTENPDNLWAGKPLFPKDSKAFA